MLSAGIQYEQSGSKTIYHSALIGYLAQLCNLCFVSSLEFESQELEGEEVLTDAPGHSTNYLRVFLVFVYLTLYTAYLAICLPMCGLFDASDGHRCSRVPISFSFLNCYPDLVKNVLWVWSNYLAALYRRSSKAQGFFVIIWKSICSSFRSILSLIPDSVNNTFEKWYGSAIKWLTSTWSNGPEWFKTTCWWLC